MQSSDPSRSWGYRLKPHRYSVIVGALIVAIIAVGLVAKSCRGSVEAPLTQRDRDALARMTAVEARQIALETIEPSGTTSEQRAQLQGVIEQTFPPSDDPACPHTVLPPSLLAGLIDAIADYYEAMMADDAEPYIRLARSEGSRWTSPEDEKAWRIIESLAAHLELEMDRGRPEESLRAVLNARIANGERIARFAIGDDSGGLYAAKVGVRGARDVALLPLDDDKFDSLITGPTGTTLRFREPAVDPRAIAYRDGAAYVACSYQVVRKPNGGVFLIVTTWCYDPQRDRWFCIDLYRRGRTRYAAIY